MLHNISFPPYMKFISLCVSIWLCCSRPGHCDAAEKVSARIVGGSATTIKELPFLVYLRKNGVFFCGGSLVTSLHVVTAAHCVNGLKASSLTVVGGASDLSETGVRRGVTKIHVPTGYRSSSMHMDVAVLKLSGPMTGNNVGKINLCDSSWKVGDLVQIAGWGQTSERNEQVPNRVRTVKVPLISKAQCKRQYGSQATLTSTMFCASVPGQDSCSGDSGGPVVYQNQLCGIVSWGIGCARSKYPGVYTNVKTVKQFIQKAMAL